MLEQREEMEVKRLLSVVVPAYNEEPKNRANVEIYSVCS